MQDRWVGGYILVPIDYKNKDYNNNGKDLWVGSKKLEEVRKREV